MPSVAALGRWAALFSIPFCTALLGMFALAANPVEAPNKSGVQGQSNLSAAEQKQQDEYYELFREFVDTFEQIDRNYVKEVDRKQLMRSAIEGMLTELDPYSSYIPQDSLAEFTQGIEQEFGGIGIQVQIDPESRRLTVMTPLPGTPAYKAGVRSGDIIMEIGGESTEGFTIENAVEKLKGKPGEEVSIGVLHRGEKTIEQLKMNRELIQVSTVLGDKYGEGDRWDYLLSGDAKIAYIRLSHFARHTAEELRDALQKAEAQGMQGLVLDLRFNPGGLLSQAVEVCDLFLDSGEIVRTKGRNVPERTFTAQKSGTFRDFPMVVLVNRYSASASEIVAACLQDQDRAVIIGERTWGKGSVQNVIDLSEQRSALKLTTASYFRPSGKNIHRFPNATENDEWGVLPNEDFAIKFSDDELRDYLVARRERDVIGAEVHDGPRDRQLTAAVKYLQEEINGTEEDEKPAADAKPTRNSVPMKKAG